MTATITPPKDGYSLKRIDSEERENDYAEALKYYLSLPEQYVKGIIFAENSNSDLSRLKELATHHVISHNKMVEFIEYQNGNDFPPCYGRGYGELKLIDYVVDHSKILTENDMIWKVTGRYKLLNIIKLIKTQPAKFSIYCDLKKYRLNIADTRSYAFTLQGYRKYLYNKYDKLKIRDEPNGSRNIMQDEIAWFNLIYTNIFYNEMNNAKNNFGDRLIFPRFKYVPYFEGKMAFTDRNHNINKRYILKSIFRRVFPSIWI